MYVRGKKLQPLGRTSTLRAQAATETWHRTLRDNGGYCPAFHKSLSVSGSEIWSSGQNNKGRNVRGLESRGEKDVQRMETRLKSGGTILTVFEISTSISAKQREVGLVMVNTETPRAVGKFRLRLLNALRTFPYKLRSSHVLTFNSVINLKRWFSNFGTHNIAL